MTEVQDLLRNAGCLSPYVKLTLMLSQENIKGLVSIANEIEGFLTGYQCPLMFTIATVAKGPMAEIGVFMGRTSTMIKMGNPKMKLVAVDPFLGSPEHESFLKEKNLKNFRKIYENNLTSRNLYENLFVYEMPSVEAATHFPDESFELVFIDGLHEEAPVRADINAWYPKLKRGGMMIAHDWPYNGDYKTGGFEELVRAVTDEIKNNNRFDQFGEFCGICAAIKK